MLTDCVGAEWGQRMNTEALRGLDIEEGSYDKLPYSVSTKAI